MLMERDKAETLEKSGAEILLEVLQELEVEFVFGYPAAPSSLSAMPCSGRTGLATSWPARKVERFMPPKVCPFDRPAWGRARHLGPGPDRCGQEVVAPQAGRRR